MTDRSPSSHAPRRRLRGTLTAAAAAALLLAAALPTAVLAAPDDVVVLAAGSATVNGAKDAGYVDVGIFRQNGDIGTDPVAILSAVYNAGDADCPGAGNGELFIFIKMSTPGVTLRSIDDPSGLEFRYDANGSGPVETVAAFQQGPVYNAARTNAEFSICYETVDFDQGGQGIAVSFLFSNVATGGTEEGRVALLEGAGSTTAIGIHFATPGSGPPPPPSGTLSLPAAPIRLLDTRTGGAAARLTADAFRTVDVTGNAQIPDDAIAVTGNVTVIGPTAGGYVSVLTTQDSTPDVSTVNFPAGVTRPNNFIMPLSGTGSLELVYKAAAGARTHVAIDITGYFVDGTGAAGFVALANPARIMDSRNGTGGVTGPYATRDGQTFNVAGASGIPAGAVAVVGNLTVINATRPGFAAVTTDLDDTPSTSTLNFKAGEIVANGVVIGLDANGDLSAAIDTGTSGSADLFFDVTGYFVTGSGDAYHPVTPGRQLDSRIGLGLGSALVAGNPQELTVSPAEPIPAGATAVTGNLTVTRVSRAGFVSATPTQDATPETSTINFAAGDTRANGVLASLGEGGLMSLVYVAGSSTSVTTDVLFDATGYFGP